MIHARNLMAAYPALLDFVAKGKKAAPRGNSVQEGPEPIVWHIKEPREWALLIPGRRINPFFALAEVIWMWSGKGGADFITYYNKSFSQFLDPGIPYFNAAYGKRVRHAGYKETPFREIPYPRTLGQIPEPVEVDQLQFVIQKLQTDPDTRQAVVSLWDPIKDNFVKSKDHPCNNMIYFYNRDGALHITVVIRSNDLIWGTPYNMIQFVHLQALIAGSLELEMGRFTVMCNNLHIYEDLYPEVRQQVLDWREHLANKDAYKSKLFVDIPDMRWSLDSFDTFVNNCWDLIERDLRAAQERFALYSDGGSSSHHAQLLIIWHRLEDSFTHYNMPEYWKQLFMVVFLFHVRKAKQTELYNDLSANLHTMFWWLLSDFTGEFNNAQHTVAG
jgi:hypothetical protein